MNLDWNLIISGVLPVGAIIGFGLRSLGKRFDKIDARFDKVDARFDKVDARFDKVDRDLQDIRSDLGKLSERVSRLEGILTGHVDIRVHGEDK